MGNFKQLIILMVFGLLLAAGLNYTGRSMHQTMGGDKKFYTFLLPDLKNHQLFFCGRSYTAYQAENLWSSHGAALDELLQAGSRVLSRQALPVLRDHLGILWSYSQGLLIELRSFAASLLRDLLPIRLPTKPQVGTVFAGPFTLDWRYWGGI